MKRIGIRYSASVMIFFSILALAYAVQMITAFEIVKSALANKATAIVAGLFIYAAEILIVKKLLGSKKMLLWMPFGMNKIRSGILAFLLVVCLCTIFVRQFDPQKVFSGYDDLFTYLLVFLLNLVPSAMTEEWLFRFFPAVLVSQKSRLYAVLFYVGITFLFMLLHLPRHYMQGNMIGLQQVFISGIAFLIIYQLTQNLAFVVLVHAFTNTAWFIYDSSSNWPYLYVAIAVVSLSWGFAAWVIKTRFTIGFFAKSNQ